MKPILLVLTGGTIGSVLNNKGKNKAGAKNAVSLLQEHFAQSESSCKNQEFKTVCVLDILSENMSGFSWTVLLTYLKRVDWDQYAGMIVAHGTDTMAYMTSFLSLVLADITIPVCVVGSQYNLATPNANGHDNFAAAVEWIVGQAAPGVYMPYRNSDGVMWLHRGERLNQSRNYSNDFFSADMQKMLPRKRDGLLTVRNTKTNVESRNSGILEKLSGMNRTVLKIDPYVGLDYNMLKLQGIRCVVHGTYHASTACASPMGEKGQEETTSLLWFLEKCRQKKIPVFLHPCNEETYSYESTGKLLKKGAVPVWGMTPEMTYTKAWVGVNLNLTGQALVDFMKTDICDEFVE